MATDWQPYGEEACSELAATPALENLYNGFAPVQAWRPETAFEKKGKAQSHGIYELVFRKKRQEENGD